ncbi:MAG: hypothetical protein AAB373_00015 [Patescibacteria group bacterium]
MKIYNKIFVSLGSSLITLMLVFGGYSIYAEDNYYDFQSSGPNFYDVFDAYNGEMNALFNDKISQLNELVEADDFYSNPEKRAKFLPPSSIDPTKDDTATIVQKCGQDNLSTYCVSIEALERYVVYVKTLQNIRGQIDTSLIGLIPLINVLDNSAKNDEKIDEEIAKAKVVMEATVAAYNEYRLAYPVHKKYQLIATDLIKYKLALKDIRKQVTQFPIEFIDATSSQVP